MRDRGEIEALAHHPLIARKAQGVMIMGTRTSFAGHVDLVNAWHPVANCRRQWSSSLGSVPRLQSDCNFGHHCCPRTDEQLPSEKPEMPEANPLYKGSRKMSGRAAAQAAALTEGHPSSSHEVQHVLSCTLSLFELHHLQLCQ